MKLGGPDLDRLACSQGQENLATTRDPRHTWFSLVGCSLFGVWSTELIPLGVIYDFAPSFSFGHFPALFTSRWPSVAVVGLLFCPGILPRKFSRWQLAGSPFPSFASFFTFPIAAVLRLDSGLSLHNTRVIMRKSCCTQKKKKQCHAQKVPARIHWTGKVHILSCRSQLYLYDKQNSASDCSFLFQNCRTFSSWLRRVASFSFWSLGWPYSQLHDLVITRQLWGETGCWV